MIQLIMACPPVMRNPLGLQASEVGEEVQAPALAFLTEHQLHHLDETEVA